MTEIVPMPMSGPAALALIRDLARDTNNILFVSHARERGRQRAIPDAWVFAVLRRGHIAEGPSEDARGNWRVTMRGLHAGEEINCVVVIERVSRLLIITVYRG